MALKTKQKRFKEISGKMDTGGAPIYNDDLIMLQQNSDADFINANEYYRRRLPALMYYNGIGNPLVKNFENGLILSGLTYDNTNPLAPVLSEGYFLSGGEVCYYAGGTFVAGANPFLVYLKKGAASYTSRVFNDGFNKEITVNYSVVVETSTIGGTGVQMPSGTTIVPTDEVVVIEMGNVSDVRVAESYFTKDAAMNVQALGARVSTSEFYNVTNLGTGVTLDGNRIGAMVSRVDKDGFTEIYGSISVAAGTAGNSSACFRLDPAAAGIVALSGNVPFTIAAKIASINGVATAAYLPSTRQVTVYAPDWAPTPNTFTDEVRFYFDCKLIGNVPTAYTFTRDFLDIT